VRLLICMLILAGTCPHSRAQLTPVKFEQVGDLEDLSFVQTKCVFQDSRGLIWIGTTKGLDRWDGNRMMSYSREPFDTLSLIPQGAFVITEDNQNKLWFSNEQDLYKFDLESESFDKIKCPEYKSDWGIYSMKTSPSGSLFLGCLDGLYEYFLEKDSLTYIPLEDPEFDREKQRFLQTVYQMEYDTSGTLWLASKWGLLHYDTSRGVLIPHYFHIPESYQGKIICFDICPDQDGNLWLLDYGSALVKFNPFTNQLDYITEREFEVPPPNTDGGIQVDRMGKIWFGMAKGLWQHDPYTGHTSYQDPSETPTVIRDIMEDKQGNLFLATSQGVELIDRKAEQIKTYSAKNDFQLGDGSWTNSVVRDDQILWIGTSDRGVIKYHPGTGIVRHYRAGDQAGELASDRVFKILKDRKDRIWVMAGRELYRYNSLQDRFERFPINLTHFITQDNNGFFWISGIEYLLRFDPINLDTAKFYFKEPLPFLAAQPDFIPFIRDREGIFWLGGLSGLYRLDHNTGNWTLFSHSPGNSYTLPVNDVRSIMCDKKNRLWVGTSSGLSQVISYPGTGSFSFKNGFLKGGSLGRNISRIVEDDAGNIWFGTILGVYVLRSNGSLESFTNRDGFPDHPRKIWMLNLDQDGSIYAGIIDFLKISPEFLKPNEFIPPVILTELRVSGELVYPGEDSPLEKSILFTDRVELKHDKNFFRIDFASLNYTAAHKNRYRYILEGVDPDTVEAGHKSYAEYTDLAPGKYSFWVTGSNNTGVWNKEGTSVFIWVHPPWYKTQAALIIYVVFFLSLIYAYLWFRTAKFRRDKLHLEKQVSERTSELRKKNEQIVEMERLKTGFFNNVSHEIRTPLSLITGPLDNLIKQDHPDPKTGTWLSMIGRNSERLHQLVNQLLDISKLDSGKMKLVLKEGDVMRHIRMLVNEYYSLAESRNVSYVIDVAEKEQLVWYDREKVEKIITNLLSNAFKFTPEFGIITCRVKLLTDQKKGSGYQNLRIIVADTGPGIPLAEREKIFERFYQAERDLYEDSGGTGIGLSLTQELIKLMHGEVKLKSLEGLGAVFIVTIPLGKEHLQKDEYILKEAEINLKREKVITLHEPKKSGIEEEADQDIEILVIEDNEDLRTFINVNFSSSYRLLQADDGIRGLNLALAKTPDLIISDVMMPGIDGMELCQKLKNDERTSHIPVILLTAKSTREDKIEGLEMGADDYIFKPFSIEELSARICNLLEQRERLRKKYSSFLDLGLDAMTVSSLDEKFLKKAIRIIEEKLPDFDFDVSVLQDKMAMSRSQLFRKMKALTGESPVHLIRLMRLRLAASLIEKGEDSITDILMSVGFTNPSYFARCFKEKFGVTPRAFQQAHT